MMNMKRRQFLNAMTSAGAIASLGGATSLFPSLASAASPQFDDYKALVVFFLHGGNDAYNMIVPLGSDEYSGYDSYRNSRGEMAISSNPLDFNTSNPYASAIGGDAAAYRKGVYTFADTIGINGVMPELAQLFSDGKASAVANIGTLIEPVTKDTLGTAKLPPFLYAHNHQQRAMETGWADNLSAGGWAGRLADMWSVHEGGVNGGSPLGMNVSYGGATRLMTANFNSPVVLKPGGSTLFSTRGGFSTDMFAAMNGESSLDHPLRRVLKQASRRAVTLSDTLADLNVSRFDGLKDPYDNPLFSRPTAEQLQLSRAVGGGALRSAGSAAQMVELGNRLGLGRQIIFIDMGGFDNHTDLLARHPLLLRELSLAMWSFQQAMDELGLADQVTLCTMSDFGRSLGNNGDGTDHAWAGHNLVMGGAVNGGKMFGEMPDLRLGESNDTGRKGRMIPAIAIDQYLATLCSWFGVSDEELIELFPNLENFMASGSDSIRSAFIPDLMAAAAPAPEDPGADPEPDPGTDPDGRFGIPLLDLLASL